MTSAEKPPGRSSVMVRQTPSTAIEPSGRVASPTVSSPSPAVAAAEVRIPYARLLTSRTFIGCVLGIVMLAAALSKFFLVEMTRAEQEPRQSQRTKHRQREWHHRQ